MLMPSRNLEGKAIEIGKLVCVGRNYVAHAKELNNEVPTQPVLFLKPASSIIGPGDAIIKPEGIGSVHHEVELGVVIGKRTKAVNEDEAMDSVEGYVLLLDMTARDVQLKAKEKGLPWSVAKGYDTFCPLSDMVTKEAIPDPYDVSLWLKVNGETRQDSNTSLMIFKLPTLISYISNIMTLEPGDIIATGTPAGVGPVEKGDYITSSLVGIIEMENPVQ